MTSITDNGSTDREVNYERLRAERDTNNPYLVAYRLLWRRLIWDVRFQSWISRGKLKRWKDRYRGQKAVIVCNGPSLRNTDLSLLKDVFTFGLNKINLIFEESDFRPSCIVAVNRFVIEQNAEFYNATNIPLFLDKNGIWHVKPRNDVVFLHSETRINKFARDCSISIYQGFTVTFVAMQLAFHMGFREVALIGCDHYFESKGPANSIVVVSDEDPNHFHQNYFSPGQSWQLPDIRESERSYCLAKGVYEAFNRKIVNSTVGGHLEIFDRMNIEHFLQ